MSSKTATVSEPMQMEPNDVVIDRLNALYVGCEMLRLDELKYHAADTPTQH